MTPEQLAASCGTGLTRATSWFPHITQAMEDYEITGRMREAAFLSQIAHESGHLRFVREIWGPTPAQERYEGRTDLGNIMPGDGHRYLGRGLIQITGRTNYRMAGAALGIPAEEHPELLEAMKYAALSAAWFWASRGLNELADNGEILRITRRINGGTNGLADRMALYKTALEVIS